MRVQAAFTQSLRRSSLYIQDGLFRFKGFIPTYPYVGSIGTEKYRKGKIAYTSQNPF